MWAGLDSTDKVLECNVGEIVGISGGAEGATPRKLSGKRTTFHRGIWRVARYTALTEGVMRRGLNHGPPATETLRFRDRWD